jgi:hypothetical protein
VSIEYASTMSLLIANAPPVRIEPSSITTAQFDIGIPTGSMNCVDTLETPPFAFFTMTSL